MSPFVGRIAGVSLGLVLALAVVRIPAAGAQDDRGMQEDEPDTTAWSADVQTEQPGTASPTSALAEAAQAAAALAPGTFFHSFSNQPLAGVKADVRQFSYYSDLKTDFGIAEGTVSNTAKWSWEEYRKQDKTIQKRSDNLLLNLSKLTPLDMSVNSTWDWSEDKTVNTAGFANLTKRDVRSGVLSASQPRFGTGRLFHDIQGEARIDDQRSVNQGQRNDFKEASASGHIRTGMPIGGGVSLVGRLYGKSTAGDRYLGQASSPSTATADSLGFGVYFQRALATGKLSATRSNFDRKYLDFRKNSSGLIDTVGLAEQDKTVDELETNDAVSIEFENTLRLRRTKLLTKFTRIMDDVDYRVSLVGLKERQQDVVDLTWSFGMATGDSFAVSYKYLWKWDDQRIKGATFSRGRQYTKSRNAEVSWYRTLFAGTFLTVKYHEGLDQDIAEKVHNQNDKDRQATDFSVRLDRDWPGRLKTAMIFAFKESGDISIRESRSSNNNIKDSYEISPGYVWNLSPWLTWDQNYQVFIQYTDYVYSYLESINRADNYNKRGNLATKVTVKPTKRLDLVVRHDYNRRFNATATSADAGGGTYYHKDVIQTISKINFGLTFRAAEGFTLEGATFQTEDLKDSYGRVLATTRTAAGEVWVGAKVDRSWGSVNPVGLSAMVKKFNAYGPSVNETSADYWEADIRLKWTF